MTKHPLAQLLADHKEEILRLAAKYGAFNMRVFGSVARGDETEDSDIDLLVDFEGKYTLWDWIKLQNELQAVLQHKVDLSIQSQTREELRPHILKDARPI